MQFLTLKNKFGRVARHSSIAGLPIFRKIELEMGPTGLGLCEGRFPEIQKCI